MPARRSDIERPRSSPTVPPARWARRRVSSARSSAEGEKLATLRARTDGRWTLFESKRTPARLLVVVLATGIVGLWLLFSDATPSEQLPMRVRPHETAARVGDLAAAAWGFAERAGA